MIFGVSNMMNHDRVEYDCMQQAMFRYPFRMIPQSYFDRVKALMDKRWSREKLKEDFISTYSHG